MNDCKDCENIECVDCKNGNRFEIQLICDEKCIFDKKTEEIYCKTDLNSLCGLMNKLCR